MRPFLDIRLTSDTFNYNYKRCIYIIKFLQRTPAWDLVEPLKSCLEGVCMYVAHPLDSSVNKDKHARV